MQGKHILSATDISAPDLQKIFWEADRYKKTRYRDLEGYIIAIIFYQPSTRTLLSFDTAVKRMGGDTIVTVDAKEFSSVKKGESVEDMFRVVSEYADAIVLRHDESGGVARAASASLVPVINAGDGSNEHPTQAYLDFYTIWKARQEGRLPKKKLKIAFHGDNEHSRTVRSLALLLANYGSTFGIELESVIFSGIPVNRLPSYETVSLFHNKGIRIEVDVGLLPTDADVVYVTRPQIEHHTNVVPLGGNLIVTPEEVNALPEHALLMHPLPRVKEIPREIDSDHRAYYFKQVRYGMFIRMALLKAVLLGLNTR